MADPPSGTVPFLFTDIEGCTRLWEQQPQAMQAALAHHDALLRQAIEAHGGHVFKTIGDGFCAAFTHSENAVRAAIAIQHALQAEEQPYASALPCTLAPPNIARATTSARR